ncbi:hypothetical protein ACJMK2_029413 [Sinanodonta woodiana]|uniref:Uncharacterized protein n=1 Tax=Sinanodonta woodiana TaxID=1069815 RepID=A0ABD3XDX5_SINWO
MLTGYPAKFHDVGERGLAVDEYIRTTTPVGGGEAYRCPVSTPANSRRPVPQKYVNIPDAGRYSFSIPANAYVSKHVMTKRKPNQQRKPVKNIRQRSFDYYYVKKKDVGLGTVANTSWLNSLCSQPVVEIFTKYKRRFEAEKIQANFEWSSSTPGEIAIQHAWTSNSSNRSIESRSDRMLTSADSKDYSKRLLNRETVSEYSMPPQFALLPVSPSSKVTDSSYDKPRARSHAHISNNHLKKPTARMPLNGVKLAMVDNAYYDQFQRDDKRFPFAQVRKRVTKSGKLKKYVFQSEDISSISPVMTLNGEDTFVQKSSYGTRKGNSQASSQYGRTKTISPDTISIRHTPEGSSLRSVNGTTTWNTPELTSVRLSPQSPDAGRLSRCSFCGMNEPKLPVIASNC